MKWDRGHKAEERRKDAFVVPSWSAPIHGAVTIPHRLPPLLSLASGSLSATHSSHIQVETPQKWVGDSWGRVCLKYAADPKHNKYLILFY